MKHYFCALVNDDAYLEDGCLYFEGEPNLVLQKRDEDGNILAEKEITKLDLDTNEDFNTYNAVDSAFPELDAKAKEIITRWYEAEDAIDDFTSVEEFAEYIKLDIYEMLDAADGYEQKLVNDALEKSGYAY